MSAEVAVTDTDSYFQAMIGPEQIRAARALLGWKQTDLAAATGLALNTIRSVERKGSNPEANTLTAIEKAFSDAGIVLLEIGQTSFGGGRGVRFRD